MGQSYSKVPREHIKHKICKMASEFSNVIVCELPDSYATAALGLSSPVNMDLARQQWKSYVRALENLGCQVTTLPADEKFPDCVFVEDTAVIVMGHALLTKPGDPSRTDEIKNMRPVLEKQGLIVMEINDPSAKLDGGDVIFTGKEILVGLSSRTNQAGVDAVSEAFPGFPVTGIPVSGPLHLKTLITLCSPDTFAVSTQSGHSVTMYQRIQKLAKFQYKCLEVPDDMASNVIYMNGALLHKSWTESRESAEIFCNFCSKTRPGDGPTKSIDLDLSEIEKAVGSLTCMSLRFNPNAAVA